MTKGTDVTDVCQRRPAWTQSPRLRRLRAARVARLLRPGAQAGQAWVSIEAAVAVGERTVQPLCVVAREEPPVDGVLRAPPLLVVIVADDAAIYLGAGARAVWQLHEDAVVVHRARRPPRVRTGAQRIAVPGHPALGMPARRLLAALEAQPLLEGEHRRHR